MAAVLDVTMALAASLAFTAMASSVKFPPIKIGRRLNPGARTIPKARNVVISGETAKLQPNICEAARNKLRSTRTFAVQCVGVIVGSSIERPVTVSKSTTSSSHVTEWSVGKVSKPSLQEGDHNKILRYQTKGSHKVMS